MCNRYTVQGTHGARCTIASPTVQLCSRAPSPRCERHLLHRAAPCTTVQADFPAPPCIGTDGARGLHRVLAPQRCRVAHARCMLYLFWCSLVANQRLLDSKRLPIVFLSFLDGLEPIQSHCKHHRSIKNGVRCAAKSLLGPASSNVPHVLWTPTMCHQKHPAQSAERRAAS